MPPGSLLNHSHGSRISASSTTTGPLSIRRNNNQEALAWQVAPFLAEVMVPVTHINRVGHASAIFSALATRPGMPLYSKLPWNRRRRTSKRGTGRQPIYMRYSDRGESSRRAASRTAPKLNTMTAMRL